jgi:hypothetical protein
MDKKITPTKEQIINLLDAWIRQRPGLEFCNYGDVSNYRAELRHITRDLHDARELLRSVELSGITAPALLDAFSAFSGRLQITTTDKPGEYRLDYCTGQYWPTEYRVAACAVLSRALWEYYRSDIDPNAEHKGDLLRAKFSRLFGRRIAARWFD